MAGWFDAPAFVRAGFFVFEERPEAVKVVKGRCEIDIRKAPEGVILDIPILSLRDKRTPSSVLMEYLLERNGAMNGPGFFAIKDGVVCYKGVCKQTEDIEALASGMQITVERLGPKIINVSRQ